MEEKTIKLRYFVRETNFQPIGHYTFGNYVYMLKISPIYTNGRVGSEIIEMEVGQDFYNSIRSGDVVEMTLQKMQEKFISSKGMNARKRA